jgi:type IV secretion system protein VirB2
MWNSWGGGRSAGRGPLGARSGSALRRGGAKPDWRVCANARIRGLAGALWLAAMVPSARAAGSNMPWEEPLQAILESVQGPVARIVAVIIIIVTGLTLAFGDTNGGFRRLIQIVFGLSIAFAASSFFLSFFSFAGGAVLA